MTTTPAPGLIRTEGAHPHPASGPGDLRDGAPAPTGSAGPPRGAAARAARLLDAVTPTRAAHQAAVFRIGLAFAVAAFLVREWPNRRVLWGDRSPWPWDVARQMAEQAHAFGVLTWWPGRWWFELVYHATIVAAVLLLLGWRSRATSVLLMVGVLSLVNRNTMVTDGGDNIVQIMVIYLVFTRCGEVWSLDARRGRRTGGEPGRDRSGLLLWQAAGLLLLWFVGFPAGGWAVVLWTLWAAHGVWRLVRRRFPRSRAHALLDAATAMLHNSAMLVVAAQVCLIYSTAGWYKIQGSHWQDGTALYFPLTLPAFTPWPWLSHLVGASAVLVLVLTYGTVILQVSFPFVVFNRRIKNVLLPLLIMEHVGIAVVLGLPFLSLIAIVCDTVFLPTAFLLRLERGCAERGRRLWGRARRVAVPAARAEPAAVR